MVGFFNPFDSVNNATSDKDAQANIAAQAKLEKTVTSQQAEAVAQIYKQSPWIPPSVILSLAKGGASQQATNAISNVAGKDYIATNTPNKPDNQSWFERNVYGKAKAASRYAFAALQFTPDLVQNAASQAFSSNDPAGVDGWFKSTQLGTMMSGENTGQGFFFGGEAATNQARRAREFRGTINDHAWTIGRGAADIVFTPGSREYSLLSGFLDGAVNVFADPTLYAGQALKAAKTADLTADGVKGIKGLYGTKTATKALAKQLVEREIVTPNVIPKLLIEESAIAAKIARGDAGLTKAESAAFQATDYFKWFDKSKPASRFAEKFSNYAQEADSAIISGKQSLKNEGLVGADLAKAEAALIKREKALVAAKIMEDMPDGSITADVALVFADANTPTKVKATLASIANIGIDAQDMKGIREIGQVRGVTLGQYAKEQIPLYRSVRNNRFFTQIPNELVIRTTSGMDRSKSIATIRKYMQGMGLQNTNPTVYNDILAEAVNAMSEGNTATRRNAAQNLYKNFIGAISDNAGIDRGAVGQAYDNAMKDITTLRALAADETGRLTDGGAFQILKDTLSDETMAMLRENFRPDEIDRLAFGDAASLVQMIDDIHILPDYRKFRALAENSILKGKLTRTGKGDLRSALGAVEQIQNEIWKPVTLATGGFVVRNMVDSHIRIAASGYSGFFSHPLQFIQTAMGRTFIGALTEAENGGAKVFEDTGPTIAARWKNDIRSEHAAETSSRVYRNMADSTGVNETFYRSNQWTIVSPAQGPKGKELHAIAYVDNMGQIGADPIMSLLARNWHLGPKERVEKVGEYLSSPEGKTAKKWILDHWQNGRRIVDPITGNDMFLQDLGDLTDAQRLANFVERQATAEVSNILRGDIQSGAIDADLQFIVGHDRVPLMERAGNKASGLPNDEVRIAPRETEKLDALIYTKDSKNRGVGGTVSSVGPGGKVREGIITKVTTVQRSDPFNPGKFIDEQIAEIQPVAPGKAFTTQEYDAAMVGSDSLREHINFKRSQNQLANQVRYAIRQTKDDVKGLDKISKFMDIGVKWFFNGLVGTAQYKLERSPLWRQAFYKEVASNAKLLSEVEQTTLRSNIDKYVAKLNEDLIEVGKPGNITAEKYVGNKDIYDQIFGTVAKGDATVADLEQYAGAFASSELQRILYDAHSKSNLEDQLRVIAPFATAFRETLGKYTRYLVEDPSRIRKTQLAYTGVNYDNDPDNLFAGWFGRDPINNTSMFNFPAGGWMGPLMAFPIKGAFQIANLPGMGPVAQIAASEILPDTPKLDFLRKIMLPYGDQTVSGLVPGWARRGYEAVKADTTNMGTVFGNTYAETVKYHASSGNYDLTDANDVAKMYADSKRQAQLLSGLRALLQFTGPTSPQVDFRIETEGGDVIASTIAQAYYDLQAVNPDTAVAEFIKKFGENAFAYLGHKTEAIAGGLENSTAFGEWARNNSEIMEQYKKTAGYFAPGGDDFSFETYNRQLQRGERRRLTSAEMLAGAQKRIGMSIYREQRNQLGDKINTAQRDWLNQWRVYLNGKYPGFPVQADFNPGEFENTITELRSITQDDRLKNNDVSEAVKQYLNARDEALAKAGSSNLRSLDSAKAQPLRDWLSSIAQVLVQQTPEFSRIFEDKLAAEVD